jgi:steroid delta-isomerase-like uncharacterized protein
MSHREHKLVCITVLLIWPACAPEERTDEVDKNESITREQRAYEDLLAVWSGDDLSRLDQVLVDDFAFEEPTGDETSEEPPLLGRNRLRELILEERTAFPDLKFQLQRFIQAGDWAAAEWLMTGTHSGGYADLPATGRSISLAGVSIVQFDRGRVSRERFYIDLWDFREQLGVISQ